MIIDGGALLHQVSWSGSTFQEVINEYGRYVPSKYKICQRVFDGYKSKPTRNHEHSRREAYNPPCATVFVKENINVLHSREEFLSNSNNKQQLIKLLAKHFRVYVYFTMYSEILTWRSPCMGNLENFFVFTLDYLDSGYG